MKAQMKAVVASAVVIVLALAAVSGVTYSWFSDTEETDITVNTAKIDINGKYTDVIKHNADGTGSPEDISPKISEDGKDLTIENLMANRMVVAGYTLENYSTVNTVFRMYAVVEGLTDGLAGTTISVTGGTGNIIPHNTISFNNGIGYIIGGPNTGETMPKCNTLSTPDEYQFEVTIKFDKNVTNVGDFSIRMVFEAYQSDYTYTPVQTISKGSATLPSETVSGETTFKGEVPAKAGAKPAEAEVMFSEDAMNGIIDGSSGNDVKLNMTMLNPGQDDVARLEINLEGTDTTEFDGDVTITLKVPGQVAGIQVIYDGNGAQPTVLDVSYDEGSKTTSITFVTDHFSEYIIVDESKLIGKAAKYGSGYYETLSAAISAYKEDAVDKPIFLIEDGILVPASVIDDIAGLKNAAVNGGMYLTEGVNFTATNGEGNALVKFSSGKETTIIGVTADGSDAAFKFEDMSKSSSAGGTLTLPSGNDTRVTFRDIEFDFKYTDTGAWHTRSVHAGAGTLVLDSCSFTGNNVGIAVNLSGSADASIESCTFTGTGGVNTAVYARGSGDIKITGCEFNGYPIGINIDATNKTTTMSIENNTFNLDIATALQETSMTADHNGRAIAVAWNVRTATYDGMHFTVSGNVFKDCRTDKVEVTAPVILSMASGSYSDAKDYYTSDNSNFIRGLFADEDGVGDALYSYRAEWASSAYVFAKITEEVTLDDEAKDAEGLVKALESRNTITFKGDIKIDPANMSNAYGTTGINVKNGQTIDGAGYTLDINGAGGTWDSGISTTGGVIKNLTVTGSFRGIFINHNSAYSETVVLENVILDGTVYTISCDQGMNQNLEATGCTFNGWTSFAATLGTAKFVDCDFGEGSGYAFMRPYAPTEFVGCDFEAGFEMDPRAAVTFEDCTIGGVALTTENLATLVTSNIANATMITTN